MLLACAPQRHSLVDGHIISDHSCLPNDDTVAVINKQSFTDAGAGVNLYARLAHSSLGNISGQEKMLFQVQLVGNPIVHHNFKAGIQKHFHGGVYRRVTFFDNLDFLPDVLNQAHLINSPLPAFADRAFLSIMKADILIIKANKLIH